MATLIETDQILIGGPIRRVLTPFRKRLSKGHAHRKWLKNRLSRRQRDRDWRIYSPLPLTMSRLISVLTAHENGVDLPPITVRRVMIDSTVKYRIIDGRHRLTCALALGHNRIKVITKYD